MIQVDHLTKRYGSKTAVNNISFSVKRGEIVGFLGPNGAGKTTTMNLLTGYLSSPQGKIYIDQHDILEEPLQAKRHIGYLPEHPPVYAGMTVERYLAFVCRLKKIPRKEIAGQIQGVCDKTKINLIRERLIGNLSKGYCQRVGIAQALIGNPEALILDEPTVGLDPKQIIEIRKLIEELGKEHTVILSTHILTEVQTICDRIIILNNGRIIADDTEENLSHKAGGAYSFTIRVVGDEEEIAPLLDSVAGIKGWESVDSPEKGSCAFQVYPKRGMDVRKAVGSLLYAHEFPILELRPNSSSLEDIFLSLIASDDTENVLDEEKEKER